MVSYSTVATYLDLLQDSSCVHMVTASFEEGVRWFGAPFQVVGLAGPEAIIVVVLGSTRRGSQVLYSSREANNVDISCFWTAFRERDLPKIAGWQSVLPVEHDLLARSKECVD